ncbi:MAG: hypothetical protein M3M88_07060, partial [Thermoproteota archaeon]|nr:hypothetical protein [Thermoproteota archaeon]
MTDKEPVLNKKQESEKRKKMADDQNVKPLKNMVIDKGDGSITNKPIAVTIDPKTIVDRTQERFSRALKKRYQYESNLE